MASLSQGQASAPLWTSPSLTQCQHPQLPRYCLAKPWYNTTPHPHQPPTEVGLGQGARAAWCRHTARAAHKERVVSAWAAQGGAHRGLGTGSVGCLYGGARAVASAIAGARCRRRSRGWRSSLTLRRCCACPDISTWQLVSKAMGSLLLRFDANKHSRTPGSHSEGRTMTAWR